MKMPALKNRDLSYWLWKTWKGHRLQAFLNTGIGLLLVAADLAFVWVTKLAIDIATHVETAVSLTTALALLIGIVLLQLTLGVLSKWVRAILGVKAQNHMRQCLFEKLLGCRWKELKAFHTGNLTNRIEQDVATVVSFLTENIPAFVSTSLQFIGAFAFLFWMDRGLACIVVLTIPFFIICSKLYIKKMRRVTHEIRDEESRVQAAIQEGLQHVLVIKTLERARTAADRLAALQGRLYAKVIRRTRYSTISSTVMNAGFATGYLVTFAWGVDSLQQGLITYGALIAFIQLVGQIQGPVRTLSRFIPIFISAFTATDRLMELERIPVEEAGDGFDTPPAACGIRLSHLGFAYKDINGKSGRQIFSDCSFDFPPGSITGIVGETGAGKTTLIRLLLALLRQETGRLEIYGDCSGEPRPITPATRNCFAYVPQGNTLLSGTIRDNLLLGNPKATDAQMHEALQCAAADFVTALPEGLDARCGEMGDGLSEGQAQRIAIARALLRNSPILLLDEATSSLDAETEKTVLRNIMAGCSDTTVLLITHRPEALKYCTQVLDLKRIKATGGK